MCYNPILFMGSFVGRIMAHGINRLSAKAVETTKSAGLVADGGGLYLQVSRSGAKSWLYKFMLKGRAPRITLLNPRPRPVTPKRETMPRESTRLS